MLKNLVQFLFFSPPFPILDLLQAYKTLHADISVLFCPSIKKTGTVKVVSQPRRRERPERSSALKHIARLGSGEYKWRLRVLSDFTFMHRIYYIILLRFFNYLLSIECPWTFSGFSSYYGMMHAPTNIITVWIFSAGDSQ